MRCRAVGVSELGLGSLALELGYDLLGYAKSNEVIQGIFFKENPLSNIIVYCTAVASGI